MGRFRAAARVAAFFLIAMSGTRQALACEACDRAIDLQLHDDAHVDLVPAEYVAAYDVIDTRHPVEMPGFRRDYAWQLTYRNEPADTVWQPAPSDRFPGMNITLDDSCVFGLRFQMNYGRTR